ncbi:MAG: trypsin-like serine protease [Polyangiaceae bacterium]|nr:trypsin-like serine protease [Polyangiaceae bacterium]
MSLLRAIRIMWVSWVATALSLGCTTTSDPTVESELRTGAVVADAEHPEVGLLLRSNGGVCTGALVGQRTVLTAGHCVAEPNDPCEGNFVFEANGNRTSIPYHACAKLDDSAPSFKNQDLGVIHLDATSPLATVAILARSFAVPDARTVYGFGLSGACTDIVPDGHKRKYSFVVEEGVTPPANTCMGDSGGPHFSAGTNRVVAVVSGRWGRDLTLSMTGDVVANYGWLAARLEESEASKPFPRQTSTLPGH